MRTRRAAQTRYLTALSIIAIVAIAQFVALTHEISDQRKQSEVVNIAGRQRTLVERIAGLSARYVERANSAGRGSHRTMLRDDLHELASTARRLAYGDSDLNPRNWPPATVSGLFRRGSAFDVTRSTNDFVRHGLALVAAPAGRLTTANKDFVYLRDANAGLVGKYDRVVRAYVASGKRRTDLQLKYEALGLAALLITLVLEVPLLFIPMQRAVDNSYRRLVREANMLTRAQQTARLGFWERNLVTGEGVWSQQLCEMMGLPEGAPVPAHRVRDHPDDTAAVHEAMLRAKLDHARYDIEHRVVTFRGETLWVRLQGEFEYAPDGSPVSVYGTTFDITERKAAELQAEHFTYHDALTGLPNRLLLQDRLKQALSSARRSADIVALLSISLDRFKIITDSLGHEVGDLTLQAVALRLQTLMRDSDTVAKVGSNEFAIIVPALSDGAGAAAIASKVVAACAQPYTIGSEELYATASIGIAMYPLDAGDAETLMQTADAAMYKAMDYPGGNYQMSAPETHVRSSNRLALERELRRALEREELILHYQPIVGLSRLAVGVEALIRWQHPSRGLVGPDVFLPIAEETGLIVPIGDWILRTACAQARAWQGFTLPAFRVAVNISAVQFRNAKFRESVRDALSSSGLSPTQLELELTESVVMHEVTRAIDTMQSIKEMGVALSIDDFGTGFSSLSYLKQFPLDTLKIDRSFVSDLPADRNDAAIVRAVLALARSLGLRVVAEGVETMEQLTYLQELGCDELQGYYFSRPLPADAVERWILADLQPAGSGRA